jgi:hypothetical protein
VLGVSLTLFRTKTRQLCGLAVMICIVLFVFGCGSNNEKGAASKADRFEKARDQDESQRLTTSLRPQVNQPSRESESTGRNPHKNRSQTASRPTSNPLSREPHSIPGMNADSVAAILLKPGLECWQPVDKDVLYACSNEENHDLPLLFEGEITGRGIDQVSGVKIRVSNQGSENFKLASQPFLGLLSTQLEYRGANKEKAYEFVNRNLNRGKATETIGEAQWTITSSRDHKMLTVASRE